MENFNNKDIMQSVNDDNPSSSKSCPVPEKGKGEGSGTQTDNSTDKPNFDEAYRML